MTQKEIDFARELIAQSTTPDQWLTIMQFGMPTLLQNQPLLFELLIDGVQKWQSEWTRDPEPLRALRAVLNALDLKLALRS